MQKECHKILIYVLKLSVESTDSTFNFEVIVCTKNHNLVIFLYVVELTVQLNFEQLQCSDSVLNSSYFHSFHELL